MQTHSDDLPGEQPSDIDRRVRRERLFAKILDAEHAQIDARPIINDRSPVRPVDGASPENSVALDSGIFDTVGVCLSGGGIRSAAFCLGALQSMAITVGIEKIDYLSTVSGGGYIGSSVSAAMTCAPEFPFAKPNQFDDSPGVGHLRDYSNYLLPRGHKHSFVDAIAVVLRGLFANLIFVAALTFLCAGLFLFAYSDRASLLNGNFALSLFSHLSAHRFAFVDRAISASPFVMPLLVLVWLGVLLLVWAIGRSLKSATGGDVHGLPIDLARVTIQAFVILTLLDVQPFAVWELLWVQSHAHQTWSFAVAGAASFATVIAYFADKLALFLKTESGADNPYRWLLRGAIRGGIWVAAVILPLLIWLFFLWLSAWGYGPDVAFHAQKAAAVGAISTTTLWLPWSAFTVQRSFFIFLVGAACFIIMLFFSPNANSLHRFYRDKLSKAFLFNPNPASRETAGADVSDLEPLDTLPLHAISGPDGGPYHLVNAALNLQNSRHANRRGRNADFFLFSPQFVGSDATGYVETNIMERSDEQLNLGTALAISGAAVSSNMGSASIKPLAPTLALLNFRLGYWLPNPLYLIGQRTVRDMLQSAGRIAESLLFRSSLRAMPEVRANSLIEIICELRRRWKAAWRRISSSSKLYLFSEMLGRLDETHPLVYVTDGGHIENLGLYQLLKRRCHLIIAVDAEADPKMEFRAFATLQRYARIDLGVRVDLPWQKIAEVTKQTSAGFAGGNMPSALGGPHCAVGVVHYPSGQKGMLLYVKASLSGDESDYVLDYKRRNPAFPHESTSDQFFSEEQFEVYRALGFHAGESLFGNQDDDRLVWTSTDGLPSGRRSTASDVRNAFMSMINAATKTNL